MQTSRSVVLYGDTPPALSPQSLESSRCAKQNGTTLKLLTYIGWHAKESRAWRVGHENTRHRSRRKSFKKCLTPHGCVGGTLSPGRAVGGGGAQGLGLRLQGATRVILDQQFTCSGPQLHHFQNYDIISKVMTKLMGIYALFSSKSFNSVESQHPP